MKTVSNEVWKSSFPGFLASLSICLLPAPCSSANSAVKIFDSGQWRGGCTAWSSITRRQTPVFPRVLLPNLGTRFYFCISLSVVRRPLSVAGSLDWNAAFDPRVSACIRGFFGLRSGGSHVCRVPTSCRDWSRKKHWFFRGFCSDTSASDFAFCEVLSVVSSPLPVATDHGQRTNPAPSPRHGESPAETRPSPKGRGG